MNKKKAMIKFGRAWWMTVLILLAASLMLAVNSIYMAERLFEMSLNQEYIHFVSIQKIQNNMELPYNDGIDREDAERASAAGGSVLPA